MCHRVLSRIKNIFGYNAAVMRVLFLILTLFVTVGFPQTEKYDRKFFVQLRGVFGRFRDSDLQRVFDTAHPIQCSELASGDGEWRTVAFFNEKRELGDWYRRNFDEVKNDLAVFIFKGVCRGEHGPVQLTTKFPVTESIEAYNQNRIRLEEIPVNVNPAVRVTFDSQIQAYIFDLPYLFLVGERDGERLYSLDPPALVDRYKYATDVVDRWDCKSVTADNVTYQFLICRTTTLPRNPAERGQSRPAFGASAYFILSDGKEASSSVKLSFGDSDGPRHPVEDASGLAAGKIDNPHDSQSPPAWEVPDSDEKILDVMRDEFRIRFSPQSWTIRIGSAQVLSAKRLSSLESARPAEGADYCIWLPAAPAAAGRVLTDDTVGYVVNAHNQDAQSSSSIVVTMNSTDGVHLGTLQCIFPRALSAANIDFRRWLLTVGEHLSIEVKP